MICKRVESNTDIKEFVNLSDKLYKDGNTRDKKQETQLLKNEHILSNDFTAIGLIVQNEKGDTVARCIVTLYDKDDNIYFGFFDTISSKEAVRCLFVEVEKLGREYNKKTIIGPIDCSFWIGYRFKITGSNKPYICEPYNKYFYKEYLESLGFEVIERYVSNRYRVPKESDINEKYIQRLDMMERNGYKFIHTNISNFNKYLSDVYDLITKLYSSFPYYKHIEKKKFISMFGGLKYILNHKLVYLAYKDDKLKGFMINLPNYGVLASNKSFKNIVKMLRLKNKINDYILLYMGADSDSLGLGSALAELTKRDLCKYGFTSVGALIHGGKVSNNFYKELIEEKYDYVLMGKAVNEKQDIC